MATLTIFSLIITVAYVAYTVKLFGIPNSISDTFYLLEKKEEGLGYLFTGWTVTASFLLIAPFISLTNEWYQFLPFLACGALMFLGVAARFKDELTNTVHYVSAAVCIVSATAWMVLANYWYIPLIFYAIAVYLGYKYSKWLFCIEMAALASTFVTLLIIM